MPGLSKRWLLVLLVLLASRLVGMALLPFIDTTEPRYAEITRLMVETGDWITPWFEPGVPFWGKPPLSFWAQALAATGLGLSEFALRLPSWLATLATLFLTWRFASQICGRMEAQLSALVLTSMALVYVSAGTVMTDSWLALGTTLTLVSFGMVVTGAKGQWRWSFFWGLVIGLLAKGPLATVICGIPIVLWLVTQPDIRAPLRPFPWGLGLFATCALVLPWYIAAEVKSPGFIEYFIVGEHLLRFIDSGWAGDLYGSAHDEPKGMIWVYWFWATFPWGFVAAAGVVWHVRLMGKKSLRLPVDQQTRFLLLCSISPLMFFTLAGNILWTYVLPGLPFAAILIARWLARYVKSSRFARSSLIPLVGVVPIVMTVLVLGASANLIPLKTEKVFALKYAQLKEAGDSPLLYLGKIPFSARFYSQGEIGHTTINQLQSLRHSGLHKRYFLVIPSEMETELHGLVGPRYQVEAENRNYSLVSVAGAG